MSYDENDDFQYALYTGIGLTIISLGLCALYTLSYDISQERARKRQANPPKIEENHTISKRNQGTIDDVCVETPSE